MFPKLQRESDLKFNASVFREATGEDDSCLLPAQESRVEEGSAVLSSIEFP